MVSPLHGKTRRRGNLLEIFVAYRAPLHINPRDPALLLMPVAVHHGLSNSFFIRLHPQLRSKRLDAPRMSQDVQTPPLMSSSTLPSPQPLMKNASKTTELGLFNTFTKTIQRGRIIMCFLHCLGIANLCRPGLHEPPLPVRSAIRVGGLLRIHFIVGDFQTSQQD